MSSKLAGLCRCIFRRTTLLVSATTLRPIESLGLNQAFCDVRSVFAYAVIPPGGWYEHVEESGHQNTYHHSHDANVGQNEAEYIDRIVSEGPEFRIGKAVDDEQDRG